MATRRLSYLIPYPSPDLQIARVDSPSDAFVNEVSALLANLQLHKSMAPQPLPPYVEGNALLLLCYMALDDSRYLGNVASEHLLEWAERRVQATSLSEITVSANMMDFFEGDVAYNDKRYQSIMNCLTSYKVCSYLWLIWLNVY